MSAQEQIIRECQKGNLDEFTELYEQYFEKIYRFIYYKTHHQQTAEDLTSQVFIKTLENIGRFNPGQGLFSSWLYRIARNKVIDYYRTEKKEFDITGFWDLKTGEKIDYDLENKEKLDEVRRYLDKLKPAQREIMVMRIWDGLSYQEIAEILNKKEANCKMIFSRTMKKLRQEIPLALLIILLIKNL